MAGSIRRKLAPLAVVAILVGAAGCGGGFSDEGSAGGSTGEVRMLVNITPNLTKGYWEELVKPFEDANPGVDVKIEAPTGQGVKDTLPQLLALMARATALLSPDSGPAHMATMVGLPVIGLYAATNPERSGPYM